ncbi:MAG: trypsin-like peptidase domain-containing protein [Alphaproteobacteria bacterium]
MNPHKSNHISTVAHVIVVALAVLAVFAVFAITDTVSPNPSPAYAQNGFGNIIEPKLNAIVTVTTNSENNNKSSQQQDTLQKWLENFFGEQEQKPQNSISIGSGFIIAKDGLIVTNAHVVSAGNEIIITLNDNSRYPAQLIGKDSASDLALLKIHHPENLNFLQWGDSAQSKIGDWAIALGNPFGLGTSASIGLISARDRNVPGSPQYRYIQTDASINRGNSGGPLLNQKGEVIGVNTAVLAPGGASVGVGFAVPAEQAKKVINQLLQNGEVRRPWLGVFVEPSQTNPEGALISSVAPNSPAYNGKLKVGDLLISINGNRLRQAADLAFEVQKYNPKDKITLQYLRNGTQENIKITLAERGATENKNTTEETEETEQINSQGKKIAEQLGLVVEPLDEQSRAENKIPNGIEGVAVANVSGEAQRAGIQSGDVILELDAGPANSPQALYRQLEELHARQFQFFALKAKRGSEDPDWILLRLPSP